MKKVLVTLRGALLTGLVLLLPLAVTLWILYTGFKLLVGFTSPAVRVAFDSMEMKPPPGITELISLVLTLAILVLLGLLVRSYLGRQAWRAFEGMLLHVPLLKTVYAATKQLLESFQRQKEFHQVVLVEFPRKECWTVGFLTSASAGDLNARQGKTHYNVFVPTTPNPTSGYLVVVPGDQIYPLDMSVEEGITFVISGGVVSPEMRIKSQPLGAGAP